MVELRVTVISVNKRACEMNRGGASRRGNIPAMSIMFTSAKEKNLHHSHRSAKNSSTPISPLDTPPNKR
jgi:hypothetical protein